MSIGSQKSEKIEQHKATIEIHANDWMYEKGFIVGRVLGDSGQRMTIRPRTTTTAAPNTANPITFNPSPTGAVSVIRGGGGAELDSLHELSARKIPAAGSSRIFFMERFSRRREG